MVGKYIIVIIQIHFLATCTFGAYTSQTPSFEMIVDSQGFYIKDCLGKERISV